MFIGSDGLLRATQNATNVFTTNIDPPPGADGPGKGTKPGQITVYAPVTFLPSENCCCNSTQNQSPTEVVKKLPSLSEILNTIQQLKKPSSRKPKVPPKLPKPPKRVQKHKHPKYVTHSTIPEKGPRTITRQSRKHHTKRRQPNPTTKHRIKHKNVPKWKPTQQSRRPPSFKPRPPPRRHHSTIQRNSHKRPHTHPIRKIPHKTKYRTLLRPPRLPYRKEKLPRIPRRNLPKILFRNNKWPRRPLPRQRTKFQRLPKLSPLPKLRKIRKYLPSNYWKRPNRKLPLPRRAHPFNNKMPNKPTKKIHYPGIPIKKIPSFPRIPPIPSIHGVPLKKANIPKMSQVPTIPNKVPLKLPKHPSRKLPTIHPKPKIRYPRRPIKKIPNIPSIPRIPRIPPISKAPTNSVVLEISQSSEKPQPPKRQPQHISTKPKLSSTVSSSLPQYTLPLSLVSSRFPSPVPSLQLPRFPSKPQEPPAGLINNPSISMVDVPFEIIASVKSTTSNRQTLPIHIQSASHSIRPAPRPPSRKSIKSTPSRLLPREHINPNTNKRNSKTITPIVITEPPSIRPERAIPPKSPTGPISCLKKSRPPKTLTSSTTSVSSYPPKSQKWRKRQLPQPTAPKPPTGPISRLPQPPLIIPQTPPLTSNIAKNSVAVEQLEINTLGKDLIDLKRYEERKDHSPNIIIQTVNNLDSGKGKTGNDTSPSIVQIANINNQSPQIGIIRNG